MKPKEKKERCPIKLKKVLKIHFTFINLRSSNKKCLLNMVGLCSFHILIYLISSDFSLNTLSICLFRIHLITMEMSIS